jgi:hypothetical protein
MRQAFEEAEVDPDEIERLEPAMTNDTKDRHVLAAAVAADSELIVTFDLDDFPVAACEPVQRRREPSLADHEGRAAGTLALEQVRGGERRRPDRLLLHVEPVPAEPRRQVARRIDRVVGQDEERSTSFAKPREEAVGTRYRVLLAHEDAVHVDEPRRDRIQRSPPPSRLVTPQHTRRANSAPRHATTKVAGWSLWLCGSR